MNGDILPEENKGRCLRCGTLDVLGNGLCITCWDETMDALDRGIELKPLLKHPHHIPWNKGLTKYTDERIAIKAECQMGESTWNKGLTKFTDKRVAKMSIKISKAKKGKKRTTPIWSKGLTKETDERVARMAEKNTGHISANKGKKGIQISWNKGQTKFTNPTMMIISEKLKIINKGKKYKLPGTKHSVPSWLKGQTKYTCPSLMVMSIKLTGRKRSKAINPLTIMARVKREDELDRKKECE